MNFLLIIGALIVIGVAIYILRTIKDVPGSGVQNTAAGKPEEKTSWNLPDQPAA